MPETPFEDCDDVVDPSVPQLFRKAVQLDSLARASTAYSGFARKREVVLGGIVEEEKAELTNSRKGFGQTKRSEETERCQTYVQMLALGFGTQIS